MNGTRLQSATIGNGMCYNLVVFGRGSLIAMVRYSVTSDSLSFGTWVSTRC
jgi:hypothetical protein